MYAPHLLDVDHARLFEYLGGECHNAGEIGIPEELEAREYRDEVLSHRIYTYKQDNT